MANDAWRHPANTQVAQVRTFTITAAGAGTEVWTFTYTDDDGTTATVTYTEDGSPTTTEIATGLFNAWNASTNPLIASITATNPSAGVCTLTADTAGVPFTVTLAASGTGTDTETATTANVGNNDYSTPRNWQLDLAPVATNDALFIAGSVSAKYGLNQSSVAIADFRVFTGCSSQFGRITDGLPHYLRIDPDLFDYRGNGTLGLFDIGSANISPTISAQGSPTGTGYHTVYLKGSNIATLLISKGNVGVAVFDADTATVATIRTTYETTQASDVALTIGTGVTLTTLEQGGGTCTLKAAATTVTTAANCTLTTEGGGAITTLNLQGTAYLNSTGTITTLNAWGTVDFRKSRVARTVTTLNVKAGATIHLHSGITVTNWAFEGAEGTYTIKYYK